MKKSGQSLSWLLKRRLKWSSSMNSRSKSIFYYLF